MRCGLDLPPAATCAKPDRSLSPTLPLKLSYFQVLRVGESMLRVSLPSSE